MLKKIHTYFYYGNRFCGIEHTTEKINVCVLKQSKGALHITSENQEKTIENVASKLPKNQHVFLVLNNDRVVSKIIKSDQTEISKLVYKGFPNIDLHEFYYTVLSESNTHFVSLCRKDYINSIIESYSKHNVFVIDISLGSNLISTLKSFIKTQHVYTSNSHVTIENNAIVQIQQGNSTNTSYAINGLNVTNTMLLALSGALQVVLKNKTTKTNFEAKRSKLITNYKQSRLFNRLLRYGGLFILILLTINFFMFNYYFNKATDLKQVSEVNQSTKNKIIQRTESVTKKQKMVDDLLMNNMSKSAFYTNAIIQSLPESILLSEFNYQPLEKRIKKEKPIALKLNTIHVSGQTNNSEAFSNWINLLEQKNWILKIAITDFGAASNSAATFNITIQIAND